MIQFVAFKDGERKRKEERKKERKKERKVELPGENQRKLFLVKQILDVWTSRSNALVLISFCFYFVPSFESNFVAVDNLPHARSRTCLFFYNGFWKEIENGIDLRISNYVTRNPMRLQMSRKLHRNFI